MLLTVLKECEVRVDTVVACVHVRYDEEDMPNDFPHRDGDQWEVQIDIETGQIKNWPTGVARDLHMKVCDEGNYSLWNDCEQVAIQEDSYVPSFFPGSHYGDYLILDINENGLITNWTVPDADSIREAFFNHDI